MSSPVIHNLISYPVKAHQFGLAFSCATIAMIVIDGQGEIINLNAFAETLFGYKLEEVKGKHIQKLIPDSLSLFSLSGQENVGEETGRFSLKSKDALYALNKKGHQFPVSVNLNPYVIKEEVFKILFIKDITERLQTEKLVQKQKKELEDLARKMRKWNTSLEEKVADRTARLEEALAELGRSKKELSNTLKNEREMNELKSQIITLASHEFRTPLSTMLSSVFLLEKYNDQPKSEQRTRHIQRIKGAVLGLKDILDDFLSVKKLEEGKVNSTLQKLSEKDLNHLVEEVMMEMTDSLKPGQEMKFEPCHFESLFSDTGILKKILLNLLSNAIKFSPEKSTIMIHGIVREELFALSIKDEGIGIPIAEQSHLFKRFFRASNVTHIQGTGLGLHIVRKYVALINGELTFQSEKNKGSCFTLLLPLATKNREF